MKNRHKGETALVIGNGPSLSDVPLEFLTFYTTFGTNRIYLLDGFTPDYYVAVNNLVIEQSVSYINGICSKEKFIKELYVRKAIIYGARPLYSSVIPGFSREPLRWIYEGHTVTYTCLQLAYFMGFNTILLVGVDHRYIFEGHPNEETYSDEEDVNHFCPNYFSQGVRWNNPDLYRSMQSYRMAQIVYENDGRKIVNLTPGSDLDVFEKGDINDY